MPLQMCEKHFFFDTESKSCLPCHQICHQAEVRGTDTLCRELCPVDQPAYRETTLPVFEHLVQTTSVETKTDSTESVFTVGEITAISLMGVIILWTILALVYLYVVPAKTWLSKKLRHF